MGKEKDTDLITRLWKTKDKVKYRNWAKTCALALYCAWILKYANDREADLLRGASDYKPWKGESTSEDFETGLFHRKYFQVNNDYETHREDEYFRYGLCLLRGYLNYYKIEQDTEAFRNIELLVKGRELHDLRKNGKLNRILPAEKLVVEYNRTIIDIVRLANVLDPQLGITFTALPKLDYDGTGTLPIEELTKFAEELRQVCAFPETEDVPTIEEYCTGNLNGWEKWGTEPIFLKLEDSPAGWLHDTVLALKVLKEELRWRRSLFGLVPEYMKNLPPEDGVTCLKTAYVHYAYEKKPEPAAVTLHYMLRLRAAWALPFIEGEDEYKKKYSEYKGDNDDDSRSRKKKYDYEFWDEVDRQRAPVRVERISTGRSSGGYSSGGEIDIERVNRAGNAAWHQGYNYSGGDYGYANACEREAREAEKRRQGG